MAVVRKRYLSPADMLMAITNFVFGLAAILISLRIVLKLFGANPFVPFVNWVYAVSQPLVAPFVGIFPNPIIEGRYVVEFASLFALFVYALIVYLIDRLIDYFAYNDEIRGSYRNHDHYDDEV